MDFKVIFAMAVALTLGACTPKDTADITPEHTLGIPPKSISALTAPDGTQSQTLVIFDKMLRRIHQFDLDKLIALRSFEVMDPAEDHYVINGNNGNYVIDLTSKALTIFDKYNNVNYKPVRFVGKPKGTFFDTNTGIFGLYDDEMTVVLLSLDGNGEVLKSAVRGPSFVPGSSAVISSGDMDSKGRLIVALTDGSIVIADTMATINGTSLNPKGWNIVSQFSTGLTDISWVAPLPLSAPAANQLILVRASDRVAVIDTVTQAVVSTFMLDGTVTKLSKSLDPHLIVKKDSAYTLVYARGGVIETKSFLFTGTRESINQIMSSELNLARDTWSFVDTTIPLFSLFNDLEETHKDRRFKRFALNQQLATHNMKLSDEPQIEIADRFVFGLFNDELGYAEKTDVDTEHVQKLERFNLHYVPAH
jgi:hypothetical protein